MNEYMLSVHSHFVGLKVIVWAKGELGRKGEYSDLYDNSE